MTEAVKLRPEEERMLRWLLRRADALNIAYGAVELEEWGYPEAKAEMLETLEDMREEAHEWFVSYRRALGIPDPLACRDGQGGVILRGAPPHDHKEEHMEKQTVEVTFEGELISSYSDSIATERLYKTADDTYVVYIDSRSAGGNAVLEEGNYQPGLSERDVEVMWPQLWRARARQ